MTRGTAVRVVVSSGQQWSAVNRPEVGNPFAESIVDDPIEDIVAHVGDGPLHPFDGDGTIRYVEVVFEKLILRWTLPIKIFGDVGPEALGVFDGPLVETSILIETGDVSIPFVLLIRVDDGLLFGVSDRHLRYPMGAMWSRVVVGCDVSGCPRSPIVRCLNRLMRTLCQ